MKKSVLKLELNDPKHQRKAFKTVSALAGIDVISMDKKEKKLTVIGTVDPISVAIKLRKYWPADIISVGPAKEPEKKEEPKKDEPKKEEPKKEEPPKEEAKKEELKKEEPKKEEEAKTKEEPKKEEKKKEEKKEEKKAEPEPMVGTIVPYRPQYPPPRPYYPPPINSYYYVYHGMEENPNACVIC